MTSIRYQAIGATFIALVIGGVWLVVAVFNQQLTPGRTITLEASRAGLMMDPGAGVVLRGVQIGRVTSVRSSSAGARLELSITPKYLALIPANVTAQIIPPTAFGPKYVQLVAPAHPSQAIEAGGTITADHVTAEVNQSFTYLMRTLDAAQPELVNSTLNSIAGMLDGKGSQIGHLIDQADQYLAALNHVAPQIAHDIAASRSVLATYNQAAPNLVSIIGNTTTTFRTITASQATIDHLLMSLDNSANTSRTFLAANQERLVRTVNLLAPTTTLLANYSPMLSCTIEGLAYFNKISIPALGGNQMGVATTTNLYPSQVPYQAPKNLPRVHATNGPGCYGLPVLSSKDLFRKHIVADTGANPWVNAATTTGPGLSNSLFGVLAGLPGL
ncbi:MAG TPA: MCE family protein [Marmoricola sp.]|nr:MCE family protein [Marmoricola sp.]